MHRNRYGKAFLLQTLLHILLVGIAAQTLQAKEGMWLPPNLPARAADMKAEGLQIPVEMLYNSNGTGLNNAVVLFGKGCTGELISSKGLVLTNHHCGYGTVQGLSSRDKDYFAAGYWAMSNKDEIPCPGLTVTFVRKMENVSSQITYDIPDTLADTEREKLITGRIAALEKGYRYSSGLDAKIEPFYRGNQYWVILTETFKDIRLVGFPPNGIGQFGGDTDNWMWPRHNGDFSMFRIYSGKNNAPAAYSADNKPYQPKQFFSINTSGYKQGDFTMVYGFPASTQEYISGPQLAQIANISDPIRIAVRDQKLAVWGAESAADRNVFLKYTSKRATVANGWKKWQGEVRGLKLNRVSEKKLAYENNFQNWASQDTTLPYADNLLPEIQAVSGAMNDALRAEEYIREAVLGIELIAQGGELDKMLQAVRAARKAGTAVDLEPFRKQWEGFQKNYDAGTDRKLFAALMPMFFQNVPGYVPEEFRQAYSAAGSNYERWASNVYGRSVVASTDGWARLTTNGPDTSIIRNDPAWQLYRAISQLRSRYILPQLSRYAASQARLNRLYMAAQLKKDAGPDMYPDANFSLRLTYGPAGFSYQTNIDGIIAKDQPGNQEFDVPEKLRSLAAIGAYGRWAIPKADSQLRREAEEGIVAAKIKTTVPVAFIADNHTSGGNSGSPVLNARGELIGTNFDRIWEGTMSDLYFDPALSRNISVDIRYTLWVVEKFGGAGWLLKEMRLVK
jgi:hypothetical protein